MRAWYAAASVGAALASSALANVKSPAPDPYPSPSRSVNKSVQGDDCEAARSLLSGRYSQLPPGLDQTHGWPWRAAEIAPPMVDEDWRTVERALSQGCVVRPGAH